MIICLCKAVSERKIKSLTDQGVSSLKEIQQHCQAGSDCGQCLCQLKDLLAKEKSNLIAASND